MLGISSETHLASPQAIIKFIQIQHLAGKESLSLMSGLDLERLDGRHAAKLVHDAIGEDLMDSGEDRN